MVLCFYTVVSALVLLLAATMGNHALNQRIVALVTATMVIVMVNAEVSGNIAVLVGGLHVVKERHASYHQDNLQVFAIPNNPLILISERENKTHLSRHDFFQMLDTHRLKTQEEML